MNYPSIRVEGAILSPDILDRIEDLPGQKPADFGLDSSARVKDEIARAWADAQDYWRIFQRKIETLKADSPATTETRQQWVGPLLGLLGYQIEYQARGVELNGKLYSISHRATNRAQAPVQIVGYREPAGLDRKPERTNVRMSAHGVVQEFINLNEQLYGLATNGRVLRLLRDSSRLIKLSYLEFDLDRIFTDGLFADFAILYRLLHATRLPLTNEAAAESWIERYHQDSLDAGARIRDGLSSAVEQAIRDFANGFLSHPANDALRSAVASGALSPEDYYKHLLRLIYRLLFLMVIEERDLVFPPKAAAAQREIYRRYYSVQRLRLLSEKRYLAEHRRHDLWLALLTSFRLFEADGPGERLGLAPLAGDLFGHAAIGPLVECNLGNDILLGCLRSLSLYEHPENRQLIRVNYAALNVEEFGSVYEGLLKYQQTFQQNDGKWAMVLSAGSDDTQSHYTDDDLVQPLIKHSLDYLIAERLNWARELGSQERASQGRIAYEHYLLSRSHRVAEGHGSRRDVLSPDQAVSRRGTVRDDVTNAESGNVDSGEHRGGMGARDDRGISSVSAGSAGQHKRTGDTPAALPAGGSAEHGGSRPGAQPAFRGLTDDNFPDWFFEAQAKVGPHSLVPHSLLAETALLSLRVADIACGSGHILLAAARRIATELAIVRTGEEQPSPSAYRTALRDVIRTCIYGVDLNPLAVELCKVALWLEAHNPGQPLNFLDHHIKCGNAIVGFARREDVDKGVPDEAFATIPGDDKEVAARWRRKNKQERADPQRAKQLHLAPAIQHQLDTILAQWNTLSALPERTPAEIEEKKTRFVAFAQSRDAWLLNQIAAIPIAQFYIPKTPENEPKLIADEQFRRYWTGGQAPQGQATAMAWATGHAKRFFHWFLEFPDVIAGAGFDCILGNPPYLGGQGLSGTFGHPFCCYVKWEYAPTGLSDLVVYFVRRIFGLLKPSGFTAFITTNSIKDGDIRKDGLEQVLVQGGEINMAVRAIKWPGRANLVVSLLALHKGPFSGRRLLDAREVSVINAFLDDSQVEGEPVALNDNASRVFQGSIFLGDGFLLSHEQAARLIAVDPRNREVIFEVINGSQVNNEPNLRPGRSIINFHDWDECRARQYPLPFQIVEQKVKPERLEYDETKNAWNREVKARWWLFGSLRVGLYQQIGPLNSCFVSARTTKYLSFAGAPCTHVFLDTINVFTTDRWDLYAVVQSTLHEVWARKYSGALKQDLRYSPSKCFDTFAFPEGLWQTANAALAEIGERYHEHRKSLMLSLWLGLTDIYNLFHARDLSPAKVAKVSKKPDDEAERGYQGLLELRRLHVALDLAVRDAYGWQDPSTGSGQALDLRHDFHEVETLPENDRVRYTISPAARKEVLRRLLALNHVRAAAAATTTARHSRRTSQRDDETIEIFSSRAESK